jgi:acetylornithine deacetylase/succinyl-diaminopimelate desuccinylase-like protein
MGVEPILGGPSSTDSNLPISIGVPAITIGSGGDGGNGHAPTEWFDPKDYHKGIQNVFLTILGLVGVDGVSEPTLPKLQK